MSDPLRPPSSSETLEMRPTTSSPAGIDDIAEDIGDDEPKGEKFAFTGRCRHDRPVHT